MNYIAVLRIFSDVCFVIFIILFIVGVIGWIKENGGFVGKIGRDKYVGINDKKTNPLFTRLLLASVGFLAVAIVAALFC